MALKVVFLAETDFANTMTSWSKCLNKFSEKVSSSVICRWPHPFGYSDKHDLDLEISDRESISKARKILNEADLIVCAEERPSDKEYDLISRVEKLLSVKILGEKRLFLRHPGSIYRSLYDHYNSFPQRDKVEAHLYTQDLYRLSPKEENDYFMLPCSYSEFSVDSWLKNIKKKITSGNRLICHSASSRDKKGSGQILSVMKQIGLGQYGAKYKEISGVSSEKSKQIKRNCLFYIDQFNQPIGGFGVSSAEAFISGCFTFSSTNNVVFSDPVISLGQSQYSFKKAVTKYLSMSDEELLHEAEKMAVVIEENYSARAVCKRLEQLFL